MRSIAAYLFGVVVLALGGWAAVSVARFERHMADAQQQAATLDYAGAQESLDAAAGYLEYGQWLPGGRQALNDVRAQEAALQYWQRQYEAIVPAQAEPVSAVDETNAHLQLIVANAAFRARLGQTKDRASTVQAMKEAASGYLTVLRGDTWNEDAAYNYEYIVRLRDDIAAGRRLPPPMMVDLAGELGAAGKPSGATSTGGFFIYIPLDAPEAEDAKGGEAGKGEPRQRKG